MMNEIKRTNIFQLINPEVGPGSVTQLLHWMCIYSWNE